MKYHFDWGPIWDNRDLILHGLATTVALCAAALVLALSIGLVMGTAGAERSRLLKSLSAGYVELTRNIPLLIHMYFWYLALAFLRLPAFTCAMLGLAIYSGAYVTEIVRSGINGITRGQMQAALATGLTRVQALRLVIYPQALRMVAPSLAGLCSQLIKDSSLASVIAVAELTYEAGAIEGQTFRTFEAYITISVLYFVLVTLVSFCISTATAHRRERAQVLVPVGEG
jgi:His/Glu/Gln/Arg/opine family amino acid ABC transporter permease subunit